MHGVPSSSFLYRKLLPELASRGLRGVAFDLPGLGLAARPRSFDYSWTGLGAFSVTAVDELDLDRFHLVVHDIGGPVGFELAAAMPARINIPDVVEHHRQRRWVQKPWSMRPFDVPGVGRPWLGGTVRPMFRRLMAMLGVVDTKAIPAAELNAYVGLLKREDGGAGFLKIMQGFETTPEKQALYRSTVNGVPYPVQVVWGERDPALRLVTHGEITREAAGLESVHRLPAKYFLQEDQAASIADLVSDFIASHNS